jgi:hypothetical protein
MADDILQQVGQTAAQQAPALGAGGVGGGIVAILAALKMFATPKDVDLAKAEIRAEMAEKYAHKEELSEMKGDITYIRQRIDQIVDRK